VIWIMASHTCDAAVSRPSFVPEELFAEGDLLRREWIVVRNKRRAFLKTKGKFEVELSAVGWAGQRAEQKDQYRAIKLRHGGILCAPRQLATIARKLS
jgi:hypothetical protein